MSKKSSPFGFEISGINEVRFSLVQHSEVNGAVTFGEGVTAVAIEAEIKRLKLALEEAGKDAKRALAKPGSLAFRLSASR